MITILADYNREAAVLCNKNALASWSVQTDVLNETLVVEEVSADYDSLPLRYRIHRLLICHILFIGSKCHSKQFVI